MRGWFGWEWEGACHQAFFFFSLAIQRNEAAVRGKGGTGSTVRCGGNQGMLSGLGRCW